MPVPGKKPGEVMKRKKTPTAAENKAAAARTAASRKKNGSGSTGTKSLIKWLTKTTPRGPQQEEAARQKAMLPKSIPVTAGPDLVAKQAHGTNPIRAIRNIGQGIKQANIPSIPVTAAVPPAPAGGADLGEATGGGAELPYDAAAQGYSDLLASRPEPAAPDLANYMKPFDDAEAATQSFATVAQGAISQANLDLQQKLAALKADYEGQAAGTNASIQGNQQTALTNAQGASEGVLRDLQAQGGGAMGGAQAAVASGVNNINAQGANQAALAQRLQQVQTQGAQDANTAGAMQNAGATGTLNLNKQSQLGGISKGRSAAALQYQQDRQSYDDALFQQKLEMAKFQMGRADTLDERAYQRSRDEAKDAAETDPNQFTSRREQFLANLGAPGSKTPRADAFLKQLFQGAPDEESLDIAINQLESSKDHQEKVKTQYGLDAKALARRLRKEYQNDTAVKRKTLVKPNLSDLR